MMSIYPWICSHIGIQIVAGPATNDEPPNSSLVVAGDRGHVLTQEGCHIGYDDIGCYGLVFNAPNQSCNSCMHFPYIGGSSYNGQMYHVLQSDSMSFNIEGNEIMRITPTWNN